VPAAVSACHSVASSRRIGRGRRPYPHCRRGEGPSGSENGRYANRNTVLMFPIVMPIGRSRRTAVIAIVALASLVIASVLLWSRHYPPPQQNAVRLSLGLPQGVSLQRNWHPFEGMALSPDGEMLAFSATDASGQSALWIRPLSSTEARKMVESQGALLPFWSPDSQFVGFWAGGKLKKIRRSGGPPEVICSVAEIAQGAWSPDGTILFARAINSPINRVSPDGANATPATSLLPGEVSHMWVQFLPGGRHFSYLARTNLTSDDPQAKVYAQSLDGGPPIELLTSQSRAIAVPDYLLFAQQQNLFAQRMDWKALRKLGEPLLVAPKIAATPAYLGTSEFTASQNGVLIYGTAEGASFDQLKWYARDGSTIGSLNPVIDYQQFTLSPDAKRLALNSFHQHATGSLWLIDIATDTTTPLTFDPHAQSDPVWSPDSRYVAFNLLPNGGTDPPFLVQKIEIGSQQPQLIYGDVARNWVEDWSPDGRFLVTHDTKTVSILPLTGDTKPQAVYSSTFLKDAFHLSPDGDVIAYGENRAGRWEVFAASFPSFKEIRQVSVAGGAQPRWRGDGRELFFIDNEGQMMSAPVERGSPQVGVPKRLFGTGLIPDPTINQYAVAGDGLKFLVLEPRMDSLETYRVILHWPATLK
jgi:eukaryotic-like serine/threonine-protein kinase